MKKHLIIGGGLAGCSLAWRLIKKGCHVMLIDNQKNKSSFIAAGMINPIVFRRVTKSWRVDEFLPSAIKFYKEIEEATQCEFFTTIKIRRFFAAEQEKKYWIEKQKESAYKNYLTVLDKTQQEFENPQNKMGSGIVKNAYRVDAKSFMEVMHVLFQSMELLRYESFDYNQFSTDRLAYKGEEYDSVALCCGSDQVDIPYFNKVEIQHTKGQILTIRSNQMSEKETWNHKGFILPSGTNLFKVGATIERGVTNTKITAEGRNNLMKVVEGMFSGTYDVAEQVAGIRPTVYDRRPVMGEHPKHKGLFIFNGLGTKGYLMAPKLAEEMVDFMIEGKPLHNEVQISRFYKNKG